MRFLVDMHLNRKAGWVALGLGAVGLLGAVAPAGRPSSFIPRDQVGSLLVERLDITTFRNSLGPRRSPGMRYFGDLGLKPSRVMEEVVEFDTDDWHFRVRVLERGDKNRDGLEDLILQIEDHATKGTYRDTSTWVVTRFTESGDLIAIAFEP